MIVRMSNGNIEDVYDYVGRSLIAQGLAKPVKSAILNAETSGGVSATAGIELAIAEQPKKENAFVRFFRTSRTRT